MSDAAINKALKGAKLPYKTAKDFRKAAKDDRRRMQGEKGVQALLAGMQGGGTGNRRYDSLPLKDRMHPAAYKQLLEREARKQGLL